MGSIGCPGQGRARERLVEAVLVVAIRRGLAVDDGACASVEPHPVGRPRAPTRPASPRGRSMRARTSSPSFVSCVAVASISYGPVPSRRAFASWNSSAVTPNARRDRRRLRSATAARCSDRTPCPRAPFACSGPVYCWNFIAKRSRSCASAASAGGYPARRSWGRPRRTSAGSRGSMTSRKKSKIVRLHRRDCAGGRGRSRARARRDRRASSPARRRRCGRRGSTRRPR